LTQPHFAQSGAETSVPVEPAITENYDSESKACVAHATAAVLINRNSRSRVQIAGRTPTIFIGCERLGTTPQ
jgi:hypothetical protein